MRRRVLEVKPSKPTDAFCCAVYSLAELRLGFGCPLHTSGPL